MKRFLMSSLLLLFISSLLSNVSVRAGLIFPPHEDPAMAKSVIDAYSLLAYYSDIFMQLSVRQYGNASLLIERLKFAYIPEDLAYIIQRYNDLTLELMVILNRTENLLAEASTLLYQYRLEEASTIFNSTGILIGKAEILLKDVEEATGTISSRLGVFAAPAESRLTQVYNRIQNMLQRLRALTKEYKDLLRRLRDEAHEVQMEELKPTETTLSLNATNVFVGVFVNAAGNLSSEGEGLSNRKVTLLLDESPMNEALTSSNGSYSISVRIPYRYVEALKIEALYTPIGDDRGVYLASKSRAFSINVMFYRSLVNVTVPVEAYPGVPITVEGEVAVEDGVSAGFRNVKIFLDHVFLAENETNLQGCFEAEITFSQHIQIGKHSLTFTVEPRGVYAGTTYEGELNIVKAPSEINIQASSILVLPSTMYIEGSVYSSFGPLRGALIRLEFGESSSAVKTLSDGKFNATVDMPLNLVLSGFQELRVNVEPAEPWNAPLYIKKTVLVINPANISLVSAAFLSLIATLYTRLGKGKPREEAVAAALETPSKLEAHIVEAQLSKPKVDLEGVGGVKGGILEAYLEAVEKIGKAVKISIEPDMTLREFLSKAKPKLDGATGFFTELTLMTERILYSPYLPRMDEASRAEDFAKKIVEVLKSAGA